MDEDDKARAAEEQAARSKDLREHSYGRGHGDWPDPLAESRELTQDELGLLHSQVPGHRWNGWRPAARTAQAPGRDGPERDASQSKARQERTRELYAAVESQQRRLSQELDQSTDLLSVSEEQAGRPVVALEHAAARVAPEWAKTEASVRRAKTLQRRAERARELRNGIAAAAAALAAITTEEIAAIHLGLDTGHQKAIDWIYGERLT